MPIINNSAPIAPPQNQQLDGQVGPQGRAQQGNQARNLGLHLGEVPDALQNARPSTARIIGRVVTGIFTLGISEGIRAIVNHVRSGRAAENRPVLPVDVPHAHANVDQVNSALANNLGTQDMPVEHMAAMKEALDDLRARFGESVVPPFNGPKDLAALEDKVSLSSLARSIKQCTDEVSPSKMRSLTFKTIREDVLTLAMEQCYEEHSKEHNYEGINAYGLVNIDFPAESDNRKQLQACTDMEEVKYLLTTLKDETSRMERDSEQNVYVRESMQSLLSQMSQKTGIPKDLLPNVINFINIKQKYSALHNNFIQNPLPQPQMQAAYTKLVDTFLADKMKALETLNTTDTSKELKSILQNELLKSTFLKGDMLRATMKDGSSVDTTSFAQFLRTAKPDTTTIAKFLSSLGTQILENRQTHMNHQQWAELGADTQRDVRVVSAQALLHSNPELLAALRSLPNDMLEEISDIFSQQFTDAEHSPNDSSGMKATTMQVIPLVQCMIDAIGITITSTALADTIGTKNVDPAYAGAIGTAINGLREQNGPRSLPPDYISEWTHIKDMAQPLEDFKNQIRELKETPSPEEVGKLFTTIMQKARDSGDIPLFD